MADERKIDVAELQRLILDQAGLEDWHDVPITTNLLWFSTTGDFKPTLFEVGKPCPVKSALLVFAMFQDESEVRVYALPGGPDKEGKVAPPHRFTLSKSAPISVVEMMALEIFAEQMSSELKVLQGLDGKNEGRAEALADVIELLEEKTGLAAAEWAADLIRGEFAGELEEGEEAEKQEEAQEEKQEQTSV